MKRFFLVCLCVLCLLLQSCAPDSSAVVGEGSLSTMKQASERVTRFLVMGCDRSARLADCVMVITVNEGSGAVSVVQIPRDTYAEYTSRDYKKLNGILQEKGETGAKSFLSQALGVPLDYFLILDLDCLDRVVDAIGGVDLEVPMDMYYSDPDGGLEIDLSKGYHHLSGDEAEQFVRYRAGYANADLGRLDAQKLFLRAFVKKCNTLSSKEKISLVFSVLTKVQTDIDLPAAIRMAGLFGNFNADAIPMATLPGQAVHGRSGAWYYSVNRQGAIRLLNELLLPQTELNDRTFDPSGVFDREDFKDFHNIYMAPEEKLPLG
jgi:LCP family protein required for cell wall assembly